MEQKTLDALPHDKEHHYCHHRQFSSPTPFQNSHIPFRLQYNHAHRHLHLLPESFHPQQTMVQLKLHRYNRAIRLV